jgi:hypothetical protein
MSAAKRKPRRRTMTIGLGDVKVVWDEGVAYLQVDDWGGAAPQRVYVHLGALGAMAGFVAEKIHDDVRAKLAAALKQTERE